MWTVTIKLAIQLCVCENTHTYTVQKLLFCLSITNSWQKISILSKLSQTLPNSYCKNFGRRRQEKCCHNIPASPVVAINLEYINQNFSNVIRLFYQHPLYHNKGRLKFRKSYYQKVFAFRCYSDIIDSELYSTWPPLTLKQFVMNVNVYSLKMTFSSVLTSFCSFCQMWYSESK